MTGVCFCFFLFVFFSLSLFISCPDVRRRTLAVRRNYFVPNLRLSCTSLAFMPHVLATYFVAPSLLLPLRSSPTLGAIFCHRLFSTSALTCAGKASVTGLLCSTAGYGTIKAL